MKKGKSLKFLLRVLGASALVLGLLIPIIPFGSRAEKIPTDTDEYLQIDEDGNIVKIPTSFGKYTDLEIPVPARNISQEVMEELEKNPMFSDMGYTSISFPIGFNQDRIKELEDKLWFFDMPNLRRIDIESNEPELDHYFTEDGVLYKYDGDKTKWELLRVPAGRTGDYVLPKQVTRIKFQALANNSLSTFTIPEDSQCSSLPSAIFTASEYGPSYIVIDIQKTNINIEGADGNVDPAFSFGSADAGKKIVFIAPTGSTTETFVNTYNQKAKPGTPQLTFESTGGGGGGGGNLPGPGEIYQDFSLFHPEDSPSYEPRIIPGATEGYFLKIAQTNESTIQGLPQLPVGVTARRENFQISLVKTDKTTAVPIPNNFSFTSLKLPLKEAIPKDAAGNFTGEVIIYTQPSGGSYVENTQGIQRLSNGTNATMVELAPVADFGISAPYVYNVVVEYRGSAITPTPTPTPTPTGGIQVVSPIANANRISISTTNPGDYTFTVNYRASSGLPGLPAIPAGGMRIFYDMTLVETATGLPVSTFGQATIKVPLPGEINLSAYRLNAIYTNPAANSGANYEPINGGVTYTDNGLNFLQFTAMHFSEFVIEFAPIPAPAPVVPVVTSPQGGRVIVTSGPAPVIYVTSGSGTPTYYRVDMPRTGDNSPIRTLLVTSLITGGLIMLFVTLPLKRKKTKK